VREIVSFYRNYESIRYVDDVLVLRLQHAPTPEEIEQLNEQFGYLCATGRIEASGPLEPELREHDSIELPRLAFHFAKHGYGDLRALINAVNGFVETPAATKEDPS
jgi:hypothetical protein